MNYADDDEFGLWDGQCQACDAYGRVDDIGLCEQCAGKFERDMIRKREWDYSATAFGCPRELLEQLRNSVIREHGERLELLAPESPDELPPKSSSRRRKRKRRQN